MAEQLYYTAFPSDVVYKDNFQSLDHSNISNIRTSLEGNLQNNTMQGQSSPDEVNGPL